MKIFTGKIINKNKAKTATVEVTRIMAHPVYEKRMKRTKKYHVHDEADKAQVGDTVRFVACKPHSKTKRWKLVEPKKKSKKKPSKKGGKKSS